MCKHRKPEKWRFVATAVGLVTFAEEHLVHTEDRLGNADLECEIASAGQVSELVAIALIEEVVCPDTG